MNIIKSIVLDKFIFSSSFNDFDITLGPSLYLSYFPWLDQERLRIKEMSNELAFLLLYFMEVIFLSKIMYLHR